VIALLALLMAADVRTSTAPRTVPSGEEPLVDLSKLDGGFRFDLRYASSENTFKKKLYPIELCAVRSAIAERMVRAQHWLDQHHKGLHLLFKDCYRPDSTQWELWRSVKGTRHQGYVSSPEKPLGSLHSYGAAVDVTLADGEGELDLGTPYDYLGRLAEPRREEDYLREGKLSEAQIERRKVLRAAMASVGMRSIPSEWWHFDRGSVRGYSRLDVPLESIRAAKAD
jgi:D-alanyl-D-alanine dipeptidase